MRFLEAYASFRALPSLHLGISPSVPSERFAEIGRIVRQEFHRATVGKAAGNDDLWGRLILREHQPLVDAMERGDPAAVADLLSKSTQGRLAYGMKTGSESWLEMTQPDANSDHARRVWSAALADKIISFCEAACLIPVENPSQHQAGQNSERDSEELLKLIDRHIGFEARAPFCYAGNFGAVRPSGGTCDWEVVHAAYTAARIVRLLDQEQVPLARAHVLEIGGGIGNLAYQCIRRGIGTYSCIDIPTTRAFQTYMALSEFPDRRISFESTDAQINLLTPDSLPSIPDRSVTLIVNENSLPEINRDIATHYLRQAARICDGLILSINHESGSEIAGHHHHRVAETVRLVPALRQVGRWRHWMRPGYVEEHFRPVAA